MMEILITLISPKVIWGLFSLLMFFVAVFLIAKIHFSPNYARFNIVELFAFDSHGTLSASKLRLNIAFIITSWAFVYLTMSDHLTEWYVTAFMGAWVLDRYLARNAKNEDKKDKE